MIFPAGSVEFLVLRQNSGKRKNKKKASSIQATMAESHCGGPVRSQGSLYDLCCGPSSPGKDLSTKNSTVLLQSSFHLCFLSIDLSSEVWTMGPPEGAAETYSLAPTR